MVPGISRCSMCGLVFSLEEKSTHKCKKNNSFNIDQVEYIHCLFQELESAGIQLPMGDYMVVYDILESLRESFELSELMWETFYGDKL